MTRIGIGIWLIKKMVWGEHTCKYTMKEVRQGVTFLKCEHDGCNNYDVDNSWLYEEEARANDLINKIRKLRSEG
jgi:hypothetical protein